MVIDFCGAFIIRYGFAVAVERNLRLSRPGVQQQQRLYTEGVESAKEGYRKLFSRDEILKLNASRRTRKYYRDAVV